MKSALPNPKPPMPTNTIWSSLPPRRRLWIATLLLFSWILLMRLPALDRFVTADEHAWLARSGNFYYALAHGDWAGTFQRHHPGVTVTWAGLVGYLFTYPGYAADAPGQFGWLTEEIEPFLRSHSHDPITILAAGRAASVVMIALALVGCFVLARRLLGGWAAFLGMALIAFNPFHIAHSRFLHLDGLVSSLMLLAVLAWLHHLQARHAERSEKSPHAASRRGFRLRRNENGTLALAAIAAGLSWLTRSPALFLIPLFGLLALLHVWHAPDHPWRSTLRSLLIGGAGAFALFVLLWPAMWVDPVGSLYQVLTAAGDYAAEGHLKPTFFNGEIYAGDPGFWFYPITYLWRSTPITWIGLAMALVGLILRVPPLNERRVRAVLGALLLYALGFMLFMDIGAKKFDRYLLPAYLPLELIAGVGWVVALNLAQQRGAKRGAARFFPLAAASVIMAQALFALPTFPYYLTYYNPAMGGVARAPEVMMIGWGEGADEAGRYLDAKANAEELRVASGYTNGPLSYFFRGTTLPLTFWHEADYAAVFVQDWQRQLPSRKSAAYFQQLTPEKVITLDGLDYAHLYDLRDAPLPDYVTEWGGAIRLVTFQLPAAMILPGETVRAVFYLVNQAPIASNLNVLVRVVGQDGVEIARAEGWPWGAATSTWQAGILWPDGHDLTIPANTTPGYYRVELGFYDPATQALLPAQQAATGAPLGDLVTIDTLQVGALPQPSERLASPAYLGNSLMLDGSTLTPDGTVSPGTEVTVSLFWEARAWPATDYTAFVHLVGPDGALAAQMDKPPLQGFLPTSTWYPGQRVMDDFTLTLPPDATPGVYTLYTGFYDPVTMARLPIVQDGQTVGDALVAGTVTVEAAGR
ncbi:MAG: phospholipid carrier-dependent glycosyltransferase [Caldilineaceae bacterium]|nr:phospholipid carrier-dependent glycosyltransferase [Caldilineaceae bacterium]